MTDTNSINIGDVIATVVIGGVFLLVLALVITMILRLVKKNKTQQKSTNEAEVRIQELEKRVEQLEKKS